VVVMLDSNASFRRIPPEGVDIYWGAYLGTDDEVLMSGGLEAVGEAIAATVAAEKRRHGWILDIFLLRRRRTARPSAPTRPLPASPPASP
jgi:precorrin-6A synthase